MHGLSSVHIQLPKLLAEEIINWGDQHISEDEVFIDVENHFYGREDNPHVTILYGLHTKSSEPVQKLLKNQTKFEITLKEMFFFKKRYFNVLAIRVESDTLRELNNKLKKLDYTNYNQFVPHITIAYVKKSKFGNFKNKTFLADNFWFSSNIISERFELA